MPADFWPVVEFAGFVVAASLLVVGVWKLDVRLLATGAVLAAIVWLGIAFSTGNEWARPELITLHLRPLDALRRKMVADAVVHAVETSDTGSSETCRLPAKLDTGSDASGQILAVSLVVELRVRGSLVEQYREPVAHTQLVDQVLEITAPGYRPWRGNLTELLPDGWPIKTPGSPIEIEMQPE